MSQKAPTPQRTDAQGGQSEQVRQNRIFNTKKLALYLLSSVLLLSLSACFKTNKTPTPVPEQLPAESDSNSSLGTANNSDVNKWLIPLISEYLMDDAPPPPPAPTCGDNTGNHTGDITLITQTDVDAFLTNGVGKITGSLILDPSSNLDYSPLSLLTEITGTFELVGNANQTTLAGFDCLSTIGGNFDIAFSFSAPNMALTSISGFSALNSVGGFFKISANAALTSIPDFSALSSVGVTFSISSNAALTSIPDFSALSSVGGTFLISNNDALTSITDFSALSSLGGTVHISNNAALTSITAFSALSSVGGNFFITSNDALTSITDFSALSSVGGNFFITFNDALTSITDFSALSSLGGTVQISNNDALTSITDFSALSSLGGTVQISNNAALTSITAFSALSSLGGTFSISNNDALTSISGFNVLDPGDIAGTSTVSDNLMLNCQSPDPHFTPVDVSTGNAANGNCFTDIAVVAYAEADNAVSSFYTPNADTSYNSTGGSIVAGNVTTGTYFITFNGITLNSGSNVQVTSLAPTNDTYCNVSTISVNSVTVKCIDASTNALVDANYYISITDKTTASTAKVSAYVYLDDSAPPLFTPYVPPAATSYNSYGDASYSVTRFGTGLYSVEFNGIPAPYQNLIAQVTASSPGVFCSISGNFSTLDVNCYSVANGNLVDSKFYLSVIHDAPPITSTKIVGYALADNETNTNSYTADPDFSYNESGSDITIGRSSGGGGYTVDFSGLDLSTDYSLQITPTEGTSNTCNTSGVSGSTVTVFCYDQTGSIADTAFSIWVVKK